MKICVPKKVQILDRCLGLRPLSSVYRLYSKISPWYSGSTAHSSTPLCRFLGIFLKFVCTHTHHFKYTCTYMYTCAVYLGFEAVFCLLLQGPADHFNPVNFSGKLHVEQPHQKIYEFNGFV